MKRQTILFSSRALAARIALPALCGLAWCGPAQADVLEVGVDGVQWVSGPYAEQAAMAAPTLDLAELDAESAEGFIALPDKAVILASTSDDAVPPAYLAKVDELSRRFDLSPALLEAVVWQESRWRADAVSPKGAKGLAQLMPGTAEDLGVDANDPFQNLEGGARYLREQLDRFDGDLEKALAAYNAGPGRVEAADGIPNIRETKAYVAAVMGRLSNHSRSID